MCHNGVGAVVCVCQYLVTLQMCRLDASASQTKKCHVKCVLYDDNLMRSVHSHTYFKPSFSTSIFRCCVIWSLIHFPCNRLAIIDYEIRLQISSIPRVPSHTAIGWLRSSVACLFEYFSGCSTSRLGHLVDCLFVVCCGVDWLAACCVLPSHQQCNILGQAGSSANFQVCSEKIQMKLVQI